MAWGTYPPVELEPLWQWTFYVLTTVRRRNRIFRGISRDCLNCVQKWWNWSVHNWMRDIITTNLFGPWRFDNVPWNCLEMISFNHFVAEFCFDHRFREIHVVIHPSRLIGWLILSNSLLIADKIKACTGCFVISTCKLSLPRHNSTNAC